MDDIDRSVWTSIALSNLLKGLHERMWEAIHSGKDVVIEIDYQRVADFSCDEDSHVRVEIDGHRVGDFDVSPGRP